jgi:hypothetical protein
MRALFVGLAVAGSLLVVVIPSWRHAAMTGVVRDRSGIAMSGRRAVPPMMWVAQTPSARRTTAPELTGPPSDQFHVKAVEAAESSRPDQESLRRLMRDMAARLSDVPEERLEPLDRIAGGFRPLADTLGVAWDALLRTIPVGRSQTVSDPQAILGLSGERRV